MILIHTIEERYNEDDEGYPFLDEGGFLTQNDPIGFRDLVYMMTREGFRNPSSYPPSGSMFEWLATDTETDYRTGENSYKTLHYSMKNHPRKVKYWKKAMKAAGIIKG